MDKEHVGFPFIGEPICRNDVKNHDGAEPQRCPTVHQTKSKEPASLLNWSVLASGSSVNQLWEVFHVIRRRWPSFYPPCCTRLLKSDEAAVTPWDHKEAAHSTPPLKTLSSAFPLHFQVFLSFQNQLDPRFFWGRRGFMWSSTRTRRPHPLFKHLFSSSAQMASVFFQCLFGAFSLF